MKDDKNCFKCHSALTFTPSGQDLKEGITDLRIYCCHEKALYRVNGETFPSLANRMRGARGFCGREGTFWEPSHDILPDTPKKVEQMPLPSRGRKLYLKGARG